MADFEDTAATPSTDDVIENPVTGDPVRFLQRARDTEGELLEMELTTVLHSPGIPEHVHPNMKENFEVLSGMLSVKLGGDVRTLSEGDEATVPRGIPHMYWNESEEKVRFRIEARPAMRFELVLETMYGLARDGKTDDRGFATSSKWQSFSTNSAMKYT